MNSFEFAEQCKDMIENHYIFKNKIEIVDNLHNDIEEHILMNYVVKDNYKTSVLKIKWKFLKNKSKCGLLNSMESCQGIFTPML